MIDRNAMIAKVEAILNQFDRGNGRKTADGSVNNDLAREIVQQLQTDGDLTPASGSSVVDDSTAPDMEVSRQHVR